MRDLYVVLWKELREIARDRRTLLAVVLTPIATLPLLGIALVYLPGLQEVLVAVVDEDLSEGSVGNLTVSSQSVVRFVRGYLEAWGFAVTEEDAEAADVVLRVPAGFVANLTSFEHQASVVLVKRLGSPRADQAATYVELLLNYVSRLVSEAKVLALGELAGQDVSAEAVLSPISLKRVVVAPTGAPAGLREELKLQLGRLLAVSLAFVTTPAASYIADSLVGERERRTLEKLLSTPISRSSFILGKSLAASVVGLVGGTSSVAGAVLLYAVPALFRPTDALPHLPSEILVVLFLCSYASILASLSISLPVVLASPTIRAASISSTSAIGLASVVYLATLFVNLDELRMPASLVLAVPYASIASAVVRAALGEPLRAAGYLAYSLAFSVALILASTRLLDPERMVASRT